MTHTEAQKLIEIAGENGWVHIGEGIYLNSQDGLIGEQKDWDDSDQAKSLDFTTAPYWITGLGESLPLSVNDASDLIEILKD